MEQVPPRSESTMQEQHEKYPNDWPVITPEQERIKLVLQRSRPFPRRRRNAEAEASDRSLDRVSAVAFLTGRSWARRHGQRQRAVYTGPSETVEMPYSKLVNLTSTRMGFRSICRSA